jgi:hypothetical protein
MTLTEAQRLAKIANDRVARLSILEDLTNGKPITLVINKEGKGHTSANGSNATIPQDIAQEINILIRAFLSSDPA